MIILHTLPELTKGVIVKRPSKHIKSPYVADVMVCDETTITLESKEPTEVLGHTAALGCCGLADNNSVVYMYKTGDKTKCDYCIVHSEFEEKGHNIRVGIAPKLAEYITQNALKANLIKGLNVDVFQREKKFLNSRFDFVGTEENGTQFILEVKNVPLADYMDIDKKEKQKYNFDDKPWNSKIAYFPDGFRKKKDDTVSERAVKHLNELAQLKQENPSIRTIILFVIQREDASSFQPSRTDPIYLETIREAHKKGVEIKTLQVVWRNNKCIFLRNDLPVNLYD